MAKLQHAFEAFTNILATIGVSGCQSWDDIEPHFLAAISAFDTEFSAGGRDAGWYQCKARYFNDIVVRLIEAKSGASLRSRLKVRSELFGQLDADFCYPTAAHPVVAGEVKVLGTPPHPGNNGKARAGCSDLHKRLREVALTSLDFKVAHSAPTPIASFQSWVDKTDPGYFAFWAIRVNDDRDFAKVRTMVSGLRAYCNGVGAVFFRASDPREPTRYEAVAVQELRMERALREVAQRVRSSNTGLRP